MISVTAPLAGLPPRGVGFYDPRARRRGEGWSFLAVAPSRAGAGDWIFVGPDDTTPERWRATLDRMLAAVGPLTAGIIVDPEGGWPQLGAAERATQLAELGRALRAAALRTRVIVTSHGGFPIATLAPHLGRLVIGSPQLYYDGPTNARTWERWRRAFGRRLIPSIAGPRGIASPPAQWSTPEGYAAYLDTIPRDVPGVIVWDLTTVRPDAVDAIRSRWAGFMGIPWLAVSALDTWAGLALVVVALLALVALVIGGR